MDLALGFTHSHVGSFVLAGVHDVQPVVEVFRANRPCQRRTQIQVLRPVDRNSDLGGSWKEVFFWIIVQQLLEKKMEKIGRFFKIFFFFSSK